MNRPAVDSMHGLLPGHILTLPIDKPLSLDCGLDIAPVNIAYQTYGQLNAERSNAILICHALTGDQFLAESHSIIGKPGWWSHLCGPDLVFDTKRFFIICVNVLGGCMGTTGPREINQVTGKPYGLSFPVITIGDMVRLQARLLDYLGIERLFMAVGGSMGAMQVIDFAVKYPNRVFAAVPIAGAARHSAQNIAFHEIGRQAIMADPNWVGGTYMEKGVTPRRGLAVARMTAHVTYLSERALQRKFGRNLQDRSHVSFGFDADFQVESYLRHQGSTFVDRFDANSYLYITRAMDYFDVAYEHDGQLAHVFQGTPVRWCLISFSSDWLFPTSESRVLVRALKANAADVSFVEIESDKGHDAFLLQEPEFFATLRGFIDGCVRAYGLECS